MSSTINYNYEFGEANIPRLALGACDCDLVVTLVKDNTLHELPSIIGCTETVNSLTLYSYIPIDTAYEHVIRFLGVREANSIVISRCRGALATNHYICNEERTFKIDGSPVYDGNLLVKNAPVVLEVTYNTHCSVIKLDGGNEWKL